MVATVAMVTVADSILRAISRTKGTLVLTIPKRLTGDSAFPFKAGSEVLIKIDGKRLIVEKSDGDK